ncbi:MAG: hypothetical protein ACXWF8_05980 [Methylobacter sp.]
MKVKQLLGSFLAVGLLVTASVAQAAGGDYSFKVHNTTNSKITKILVSENGKSWGEFDIGSGIAAGATETLVWDSSTNNESCNQYFKASFADGSESESTKFDFCEKDLTLEF